MILKALAGEESKVDLAAKFGVSRKTIYKWLGRYKERGLAGLVDESRRPHSSPMMTSAELALAVLQVRKAHRSWGPKKIVAVLARQYPGEAIPSLSTTSRILRQAGFNTRTHRRSSGGFPPAPRQYTPVEPNDLWTVDFKGWWRTLDGTRCEPLTVRDAVSRYMLAMRAMPSTRTKDVRAAFEDLFDRFGLPKAIHSDNGPPFASLRAPGGLTQLSAWWVSLGIEVVRSRPGKPQDNGAHERMHVDVRYDLQDFAAPTVPDQQRAFDDWVTTFNHVRPHEALGQKVPADVYRASERRLSRCVPFVHPDEHRVTLVDRQGGIRYDAVRVYVSYGLGGHQVGLEPASDGQVRVWFCRMLLGVFVPRRDRTIQPWVDNADTTDAERFDAERVDEHDARETLDAASSDELAAPAI
jgi:transposase InsO family protein